MKPPNRKTCKNCNACKRLHRKCWCFLWAQKLFYCELRDDLTDPANRCDRWQPKRTVCDFSPQRFDEVKEALEFALEYYKDQ